MTQPRVVGLGMISRFFTWAVLIPCLLNAVLTLPQSDLLLAPHTSPAPPPRNIVTVVGGGLAGILATLETLKLQPNATVVLLESLPNFGGRVLNVPHPEDDEDTIIGGDMLATRNSHRRVRPHVEIGATFIHGIDHNPLYALARKYGIPTMPVDYDNFTLLAAGAQFQPSPTSVIDIESPDLFHKVKSNVYDAAREAFFQIRKRLVEAQSRSAKVSEGVSDPSLETLFTQALRQTLLATTSIPLNAATTNEQTTRQSLLEALFAALDIDPQSGSFEDIVAIERVLSWHFFWEIVQDQIATLSDLSSFSYDASLGFRGPDHVFGGSHGIEELMNRLLTDIVVEGGLEDITPLTNRNEVEEVAPGAFIAGSATTGMLDIMRYVTPCSQVEQRLSEVLATSASSVSLRPRLVLAVSCPVARISDQLRETLLNSSPSTSSKKGRRLLHRKDALVGGSGVAEEDDELEAHDERVHIGFEGREVVPLRWEYISEIATSSAVATLRALRVYDAAFVALWVHMLLPAAGVARDQTVALWQSIYETVLHPTGSYIATRFLCAAGLVLPQDVTMRTRSPSNLPLTASQVHASLPSQRLHTGNLMPIFLQQSLEDEVAAVDITHRKAGPVTTAQMRAWELTAALMGHEWVSLNSTSVQQYGSSVAARQLQSQMETDAKRKQRIQRRKEAERRGRDRLLKRAATDSHFNRLMELVKEDVLPACVDVIRSLRLWMSGAIDAWRVSVLAAWNSPSPTVVSLLAMETASTSSSPKRKSSLSSNPLQHKGSVIVQFGKTSLGSIQSSVSIVTTPLGALKRGAAARSSSSRDESDGEVSFSPSLPARFHDAVSSTGCSETIKIAIQFRRDQVFWPPSQFFGVVAEHPSGRSCLQSVLSDAPIATQPSLSRSSFSRARFQGEGTQGKEDADLCRRYIFGDSDHIEIVNMHALRGNGILIIEAENDLARRWSDISAILAAEGGEGTTDGHQIDESELDLEARYRRYEKALVMNHVLPRLKKAFFGSIDLKGENVEVMPLPQWFAVNNYVANPYLRCGFSYWRPGRSGVDNSEMGRPRWSPIGESSTASSTYTNAVSGQDTTNLLVTSLLVRYAGSPVAFAVRRNLPLTRAVLHLLRSSFVGSDVTGRLLFAGEHTTAELYGNMHGAVVEGQRAAIQASLQLTNDKLESDAIYWIAGLVTGWGRWEVDISPFIVRIWMWMLNALLAWVV